MAAPDHPPTVSVLLPVFNAERFLPAALASILAQTFTDWELIAVDDGSTDASPRILRDFAEKDARIRLITRPNTGIVGALNDALAPARGALIARMDADDISLPARFQLQVDFLNSHPDCVLLGTQVLIIDEDADPIGPLKSIELEHDRIDRALLELRWPIVHPTVMMRRQTVSDIGGYAEGTFPHEDHDLFLKLCERGHAANLPQALLHYRRHATSVSWDSRRREKMIEIVQSACARRRVPFSPAPETKGKITLELAWGWQSLLSGHRRTARKYALRALRHEPFNFECWKLLACVIRGH
jgi:glycosyltransferase involved in cell wall biosynthesis